MKTYSYSYKNTALVLIGITIAAFIMQQMVPISSYFLALNTTLVMSGWVWQFVTYMFAHGGITHLLCNMLALFIFGVPVEREIGSKEFLLYYFTTGILAGIFSFIIYFLTGADNVFLLGASGAIFAVQLAYAILFPNSVIHIWGILPLREPVMVLGYTVLEIFLSFTGTQNGVAHLTHLPGFGVGWMYFITRLHRNPWHSFR
ncbi:glpG protein [Spirochaetia bacterium]|nr:glpG protein [Spirochaetia bacterium]